MRRRACRSSLAIPRRGRAIALVVPSRLRDLARYAEQETPVLSSGPQDLRECLSRRLVLRGRRVRSSAQQCAASGGRSPSSPNHSAGGEPIARAFASSSASPGFPVRPFP